MNLTDAAPSDWRPMQCTSLIDHFTKRAHVITLKPNGKLKKWLICRSLDSFSPDARGNN